MQAQVVDHEPDGTQGCLAGIALLCRPNQACWRRRCPGHKLLAYSDLVNALENAELRCRELSEKIKTAEARMAELAVLQAHIINYAKTREVYVAYRKARYSKKFRAAHEDDILLHQTAKKVFDEQGLKKLPSVKSLRSEYAELLAEKKPMYAEYRKVRDDMRELYVHKRNVDMLLGREDRSAQRDREQEPGR